MKMKYKLILLYIVVMVMMLTTAACKQKDKGAIETEAEVQQEETPIEEDKVAIEILLESSDYVMVQDGRMIRYEDRESKRFDLYRLYEVRDIRGLEQLEQLEVINFEWVEFDIEDNFFMRLPTGLRIITMEGITISLPNTDFLNRQPNVEQISIAPDYIYDRPYFTLDIDMPRLRILKGLLQFTDFSFFEHIPNIEDLYINNKNTDVPMFEIKEELLFEEITNFGLWNVSVESLAFLKQMPHLEYLSIGTNRVTAEKVYSKTNRAYTVIYSKGEDYSDEIWSYVPNLKQLRLPEELRLAPGVLSTYTQVEEDEYNTQ